MSLTGKSVLQSFKRHNEGKGKADGRANSAQRFEVRLAVNFVGGLCNYSGGEFFFFFSSYSCICDAPLYRTKNQMLFI